MSTEELSTETGGNIPGKSYSCSFLPDFSILSSLDDSSTQFFLFNIFGLNSTSQAAFHHGNQAEVNMGVMNFGEVNDFSTPRRCPSSENHFMDIIFILSALGLHL